ncbi:MAG: O-antigen ligase family protein [bacterium]|nr:O-antigen ligase family protein [Candidatus Kapabacteria bacterium]
MNVSPRIDEPGALAISAGALAAIGVTLLGLVTLGLAGTLGMADHQGLYLLVLPAVFLGAFLSWINERIWVYVSILGHVVVFMTTSDSVGGAEMAFSALTLSGLCVWLFKETVIHRRFLVQSGFDALLMAIFISTTVVTMIASILHNGDPLWYMSEWTKMLDCLLYFPIRRFIRTREDVIKLVTLFALIGIAMGLVGVATYRERLLKAVFAYQIESSRIFANEPVSMAFAILGTVIVAYARTRFMKITGVFLTMSGLLFLIITFSRGAIGSAAIGIVFVVMFSGHGRRVLATIVFSLVVAAAGVYVAFPDIASTLATSVGRRVGSIGAASTDISFNLRVIEAKTLLNNYIPFSPIIGHGYGVRYHWYEPLEKHSLNHTFIHNGYVKLLFKYGYPLSVFFAFFMVYPLLRVAIRAPSKRDQATHAMMVGCVAYMICSLVNNYVSDMYSNFAGPLNYVLCWAILDYVNRRTAPAREHAPMPEPPTRPLAIAGV